jgi:hypothetical protein
MSACFLISRKYLSERIASLIKCWVTFVSFLETRFHPKNVTLNITGKYEGLCKEVAASFPN